MPIGFPSMQELQIMGGLDFPQFKQAEQQLGLANQFNQGQLAQQQQDLTSSILKNLFDAQYNPKRLQELETKNASAALKLSQDQELDPYTRAEGKSKSLSTIDDNEIKSIMNQIERDLVSDDPVKRASATDKLMQTAAMQKIKLQNDAKVQAAELAAKSRERIADTKEAGLDARAAAERDNRIKLAQMKQKQAGDLYGAVISGKMTPDKAIVAYDYMARTEQDPEMSAQYRAAAQQMELMQQRMKANLSGRPDLSEFVKTNPFTSELTGGNLPARAAPMVQPAPMGPSSATEAGMAQALAPLLQQVNSMPPEQAQAELAQASQALASARTEDEKAAIGQYVQFLQRRLGAAPQAGGQPSQQKTPSALAKSSLADVQKLYPGVPAEKLKEAYKKKFGVDLQ